MSAIPCSTHFILADMMTTSRQFTCKPYVHPPSPKSRSPKLENGHRVTIRLCRVIWKNIRQGLSMKFQKQSLLSGLETSVHTSDEVLKLSSDWTSTEYNAPCAADFDVRSSDTCSTSCEERCCQCQSVSCKALRGILADPVNQKVLERRLLVIECMVDIPFSQRFRVLN